MLTDEKNTPSVFAYSLYYVYYDQYTYITGVLAQSVMLGLIAVFVAIQVLSSIQIAAFVVTIVFLVFFELMGSMWMCNIIFGGYPIEQNAVFVVNLITSLGFGVEFCNHIGMSFMKQTGSREVRAKRALGEMGSSVLIGITLTKFIGVIVLAFAKSQLFRLYYFRMFLFIIVFGAFNGMMLLPIMLSFFGPATDKFELLEEHKQLEFMAMLKKRYTSKDSEINQQLLK
jgi:Niemann-Pick C1 protein